MKLNKKSERSRVSEFQDQNSRASFWYRQKMEWLRFVGTILWVTTWSTKKDNTFGKEAEYCHSTSQAHEEWCQLGWFPLSMTLPISWQHSTARFWTDPFHRRVILLVSLNIGKNGHSRHFRGGHFWRVVTFFFIVRTSHILTELLLHCAIAVVLQTCIIIAFLVAYHVEISNWLFIQRHCSVLFVILHHH